jgi:hypothetical protein
MKPEIKITYLLCLVVGFGLALLLVISSSLGASDAARPSLATRPTIVLVHGAFAESSSWNRAVKLLLGGSFA